MSNGSEDDNNVDGGGPSKQPPEDPSSHNRSSLSVAVVVMGRAARAAVRMVSFAEFMGSCGDALSTEVERFFKENSQTIDMYGNKVRFRENLLLIISKVVSSELVLR
ncbi:hypothetical protein ECG_07450 [Echinococcus granulosus]|nr:hypothetical protein ECG_07450 [Echinococcus granulosus]